MSNDIIIDDSGFYYHMNPETLISLNDARFQIQYDLIIEYEKYRLKLYESLKNFTFENHVTMILSEDRISLIITPTSLHDCRFYFVQTDNLPPIKLRLSRDYVQEQITLSIH
jgi:hypothetical protein